MSKEFYETRRLFIPYVNYTRPLSYDEWLSLCDDKKAAHLYCQFFNEIVCAWYKAKSFYASEQEGVETVLQYIIKNVPKIVEDPNRYSERYMYRISYNSLYCISHDRKIDKWRYEHEISNVQNTSSGGTIDVFDFCPSFDSYQLDEISIDPELSAAFWAVIKHSDKRSVEICNKLCEGKKTRDTLCKRDKDILKKIQTELLTLLTFYYDDETMNKVYEKLCN